MAHPSPDGETPLAPPSTEPAPFLYSRETWVAIGLLILILAAYLQVMGFHFVSYDDPLYVTSNPSIQAGLGWKSLRYAFTSGVDGSYLPLVWLSHAACVSLFGTWAGGHHLINVLLHGANSVLLFYFLNRLTKSIWPSASVAFLFALHPLHVESVAWVTERKDVLSTLFWILTSWAYVRYTENPSLRRYAWVALLFTLGLLSKSMLVMLPLTLLLFDAWPLGRIAWTGATFKNRIRAVWPLLLEKIPLFVLSLGAAGATLLTQSKAGAVATLPLHYRLGNALLATVKYLEQTFLPWNLSVFYPFRWSEFPVWKVTGALILVLFITVVCVRSSRRRPYLAVGWFWYLITLLPVVGIIQVGSQAHADRYTYVPLIGVFMMLAWLAEEFIVRWRFSRIVTLAAGGSMLGLLFILTTAQVVVWRDNLTLFKNALSLNSENPLAIMNIGDEFFKRDQFQDAYVVYLKGVELAPGMHYSHIKIAQALVGLGRDAEALPYYQNVKRLKPDLLLADQCIGQILTRLGRFEEAAPYVQKVLQEENLERGLFNPVDHMTSHLDWAVILASRNRLPEALQILESTLAKDPNSSKTRLALGKAFLQIGRQEEALRQMEKAVELNPNDPEILFFLGSVLIRLHRFPEAKRAFDHLAEVAPRSFLIQRGHLELEKATAGPGVSRRGNSALTL